MSTKTLLCYGDSNTYGMTPVPRPEHNHRHDYGERWPDVVQDIMGSSWRVIAEGLPGRTTRYDDPIQGGEYRNGLRFLRTILESHQPIDLVAIMLGTNDLKGLYNVDAEEIARSVGMLIGQVQALDVGPECSMPDVLVLSPLPIKEERCPREFFGGGRISRQLAPALARVAARYKVHFMDLASIAEVDGEDGVHFSVAQHAKIGQAIAEFLATY